jgi:hypothetical protein
MPIAWPWRERFPRTDSFETVDRIERELTVADLEAATQDPVEGVTEIDRPDGTAGLKVVPPKFGPGGAYVGGAAGLAFTGLGVAILVANWADPTTGAMVSGVLMTLAGIAITLLLLDHEIRWELDRHGFHVITGLRRRTTPWGDVRRLRIVVLRAALKKHGYRRLRPLCVLDADGRTLGSLPYVHVTLRSERALADVHALVRIAAECHRRDWLIPFGPHAGVGEDGEGITPADERSQRR